MAKDQPKIIARFDFPELLIKEPVLFREAKKYYWVKNFIINITSAVVEKKHGFIEAEIYGTPLMAAIFLTNIRKMGVKIEILENTFPECKKNGLKGVKIFR
jgi:hypothetical protein